MVRFSARALIPFAAAALPASAAATPQTTVDPVVMGIEVAERDAGALRLTDRFFLGDSNIRGFDILGVGPRVQRLSYDVSDDAVGGRAYYVKRTQLEIPLGSKVRALGLRPSLYVDAGAVFGVRKPAPLDTRPGKLRPAPFSEALPGKSPPPRLSIGFGVNWNSPFGPFRIDVAQAVLSKPADDTKLFSFNVGTAF